MDHFKSVHPLKYYQDYLAHNIRPDGREVNKFRNVAANVNSIDTANGSAIVRIGDTCCVCGIKAELGPPRVDEPENGYLIINVELPPLCSSQFRPGIPSEKAQALAAFINNVALRTGMVDLKSLCIESDKLVWTLYCDIVCLNFDGAVIDASFVSLIGALMSVTLPDVSFNNETNAIVVDDDAKIPLNVLCKPVSTSFAMFGESTILVDPCGEEESLSDGSFALVLVDDQLCSIHKPGGSPLTDRQLQNCLNEAKERTKLIYKLIEAALNRR